MSSTLSPSAGANSPTRSLANAWLAWIAIAGPVVFSLLLAVEDILQYQFLVADGQSPLTQSPVSENALGPYGVLQIINFALLGIAVLALAIGLYRAAAGNVWARIGVAFVVVLGLAFLASAFPMDPANAGQGAVSPTTWHGTIHNIAFYVMVLTQIPAYLLVGVGLWRVARWRGPARYSVVAGILVLPLVIAFGALPPVFSWFYIWLLVVPFAWIEMMALRLLARSR